MKFTESLVTKLCITDIIRLDTVTVYLENFELGRGKLTIEVFGDAWSSYWGAMGENTTLEDFVLSADNHYLSKNLASLSSLSEDDYEGFIENLKQQIIDERKEFEYTKERARELWEKINEIIPEKTWFEDSTNHDLLYEVGGDEFWYSIPSKDSHTYKYLCKILDALKECLKLRNDIKV